MRIVLYLGRAVCVLVDYHVHTSMSKDAKSELVDCIKVAKNRGLTEIGVSDHFHVGEPSYSMSHDKLPEYINKVRLLQTSDSFPVKLGMEVDFIPHLENQIQEITKTNGFDYFIGSIHFIDNWGFDNPRQIAEFQKWNIAELYATYFGLVQQCAQSKLFDIIAHPDLIKKFGYKPNIDVTDILVETVEVLEKCNICIEVNTSGLRMPCREIYPNKTLLKMCFDHGVPATLGSDAHTPEDVGRDFDQAVKLLKSVGYDRIVRFSDRKKELVKM